MAMPAKDYPEELRDPREWRDPLCSEIETHRILDSYDGLCARCVEYFEVRRHEHERCRAQGTPLTESA